MPEATLAQKVEASMKRRGWTVHNLARRMPTTPRSSLRNLLSKPGDPDAGLDLKVKTAVELSEALFPDLQLIDFYPGTELALKSKTKEAHKRIRRRQQRRAGLRT